MFAIFVSTLSGPVSSTAQDRASLDFPDRIPELDPVAIALHNECLMARDLKDPDELDRLTHLLVADHADQGWALTDIGRNLVLRHGHAEARRLLADRRGLPAPLDALDDPALDAVEGTVAYMANRFATAAELFERSVAQRPHWTDLHAQLFLCGSALLKGPDYHQQQLDACADDALALFRIIGVTLARFDDERDHPDHAAALALLRAGPRGPREDLLLAVMDLEDEIKASYDDAEAAELAWERLVAEYGDLAWIYDSNAAYMMSRCLPAMEAVELGLRLGQNPRGNDFLMRAAEIEEFLNVDHGAIEELAATTVLDDMGWDLLLRSRQDLLNAEALFETMTQLHDAVLLSYSSSGYRHLCRILGKLDHWSDVWEETEREYPLKALRHRLSEITIDDETVYTALVDSVGHLGLYFDPFVEQRHNDRVIRGGGPGLDEILAEPDPLEIRDLLWLASRRAQRTGDREESRRILAHRIDRESGRLTTLTTMLAEAYDLYDQGLSAAILREIKTQAPSSYLAMIEDVRYTAIFEGPVAGRLAAERVDVSGWTSITHLIDFSLLCRSLELEELMDEASLRTMDVGPESYAARFYRTDVLRHFGRHGEADALLNELAEDYPGDPVIAQKLLEGGTSVMSLADAPEEVWNYSDAFDPFDYDLDDIDAVLALSLRGADADSIQDDIYVIRERYSTVLQGLDTAYDRRRRIVQVMSEAGTEMVRTQIISFSPDDGVPRLLVARVISPDGRVIDVHPTVSFQFDSTGDYPYFCRPHVGMGMAGIVHVTPSVPNESSTWSGVKSLYR